MDKHSRDENFSSYVASRWPRLLRTARHLGCSPAEAEDLVQETLVARYRAWGRVTRADSQDAYVHRILVNRLARDRRRRWRGEVAVADLGSHDIAATPDHPEQRLDLAAALRSLSPAHRTVLVLRFVADLSEAQTALALGVAPGTVKSRVSRALAALHGSSLVEEETR